VQRVEAEGEVRAERVEVGQGSQAHGIAE